MTVTERCPMCRGIGWVLDERSGRDPAALELIECVLPDCETSGRPVEILSVNALEMTNVVRHPSDGYVMAISS